MKEPIYVCPECDSDRVTAEHIQTFVVYTGGHFSHSVKTHDSDSSATCLACWWKGERKDLKEANHEQHTEPAAVPVLRVQGSGKHQ